MRILIVHASKTGGTGGTAGLADMIGEALQQHGFTVTVRCVPGERLPSAVG